MAGNAAASEEERLRGQLAQRDAELERLRAELKSSKDEVARLSGENAMLLRDREGRARDGAGGRRRFGGHHQSAADAERLEGGLDESAGEPALPLDGVPEPSPSPAPRGEDGPSPLVRLTAQASGRNVFDRVTEAAHGMRAPTEKAHRQRILERSEHALAEHQALGAIGEATSEALSSLDNVNEDGGGGADHESGDESEGDP